MNNTGSGQDYTDPHTHSFATEGAGAPAPKKPNPVIKMVIILVGVIFVALAGFVGWGFISKKPAPAPQAQSAKPAPKAPVAEPAPASTVAPPTEAVVDPGAAVVDPNAATLTVDTNGDGIPDAPEAGNAPVSIDPAAVPAPAGTVAPPATASVPVVDPNAAPAPVSQVAPPVAPVPAEVAPPTVPTPAPAASVPPPVAVVQDPAQGSIGQVMDTARQEMMSALDRIERRLMDLEGRVSALESRPASAAAAPSVRPAHKPVRRPAAKKTVHRAPRRAVSPSSQNHIEIIDSSIAPVSHAVIIERGVVSSEMGNRIQVIDAPAAVSASSCRIQSIKPGRAWVRRADGSFASYGVGDMLPNGAVVDSIDPDVGVMANGRLWNCN